VENLSSPLVNSSLHQHLEIVRTLIVAGANPNAVAGHGTPLIAAVKGESLDIIRYLVEEAGADPNQGIDDSGYQSPLTHAAFAGSQAICDYLMPRVSDPEQIKGAQESLPQAIIRRQRRENVALQTVFEAVQSGDLETLEQSVKDGFDLTAFNEAGNAAIHDAVAQSKVLVIKKLIELGADLNQLNEAGFSPVMVAVCSRSPWALRTLLRLGADPNQATPEGRTALTAASDSFPKRAVALFTKILLHAGAEVNEEAVVQAAIQGNTTLLRRAISLGINIDQPSNLHGRTPLMLAVANSQAWAVRLLVRAGAEVTLRDHQGETALTIAQTCPYPVIQQILLRAAPTQ
jgi:ankyrin repeat protein